MVENETPAFDFSATEIVSEDTTKGLQIDRSGIDTGLIDVQIATARKFPRNLQRITTSLVGFISNPANIKFAESCQYAVPKPGKEPITGPSVHLARFIAQSYGNLRMDAKILSVEDSFITSVGTAWDLETNTATQIQVIKSILMNEKDANGKNTGKKVRMKEDMIVVSMNAANAVSLRNAIFAVIPKAVTDACYKAAINNILGTIGDAEKMIVVRTEMFRVFQEKYSIPEKYVLAIVNRHNINDVTATDLTILKATIQSLIDGDTSPEIIMMENQRASKSTYGKAFTDNLQSEEQ